MERKKGPPTQSDGGRWRGGRAGGRSGAIVLCLRVVVGGESCEATTDFIVLTEQQLILPLMYSDMTRRIDINNGHYSGRFSAVTLTFHHSVETHRHTCSVIDAT